MLATECIGDAFRDIASELAATRPPHGIKLLLDKQKVLTDMKNVIGHVQVSREKLKFAPAWVITKSVGEEITSNWGGAYMEVDGKDVPRDVNVIRSHIVYKIKTEGKGKLRLKARLCPHKNRDKCKSNVRKDSTAAQFDVIRLFISISVTKNSRIGCVDINEAYLQSGPIKREICVRPFK